MFTALLNRPDFYAKRILQWQLVLFVLGILLNAFMLPVGSIFSLYYYYAWFGAAAVSGICVTGLLIAKRPGSYLWYSLLLLTTPVVLIFFSVFLLLITSGMTC